MYFRHADYKPYAMLCTFETLNHQRAINGACSFK